MSAATVLSFNLDKSKLQSAAAALKNEPSVIGALEADPKAFLARFGVGIDDATAAAIKGRLSGKQQAKPASVVHIDI